MNAIYGWKGASVGGLIFFFTGASLLPCMEYFTLEEQDKMLAEFYEFDRKMIHEKYGKVVSQIKSRSL